MSTNEALPVYISHHLYMEFTDQMRKHGDWRSPGDAAAGAIKEWMARNYAPATARGYQWKGLFLPSGTRLRIRHGQLCYFAQIEGDLLVYEGQILSPRAWANLICGSVRNAWRDIWIRRSHHEAWTQASAWRASEAAHPQRPGIERRRHARRATD